ncbi:MAG: ABC transporter permease subunit [Pirellulales bacterium]
MAWREQRMLLLALSILLAVFGALYVYLMSLIQLDGFSSLLATSFKSFESLSGVPFEDVASIEGRIALGFVDPVVLLTMTVWAVGRGSDLVSGELDRGTYEMLLAQPIPRMSIFTTKVVMMLTGCVILALMFWLGLAVGILVNHGPEDDVDVLRFWPGVVNIVLLGTMFCGVSSAMSSWDRYRWRTIGIMGCCYATWLLLKVLYRMGGVYFRWVGWLTPFRWFEPQFLIKHRHDPTLQVGYNLTLLGIGLVGFIVAGVVFQKRDLPAPI